MTNGLLQNGHYISNTVGSFGASSSRETKRKILIVISNIVIATIYAMFHLLFFPPQLHLSDSIMVIHLCTRIILAGKQQLTFYLCCYCISLLFCEKSHFFKIKELVHKNDRLWILNISDAEFVAITIGSKYFGKKFHV